MDAPNGRWLSVQRKNFTAIAWECYELYWTSPGHNILPNSSCTATNLLSLKPFKSDEQDMRDTAGEVRTNSWLTFSCGSLHTYEQVLDGQIEHIYKNSVRTQDVVWRTCRKRCTIETNGERESRKAMRAARYVCLSVGFYGISTLVGYLTPNPFLCK